MSVMNKLKEKKGFTPEERVAAFNKELLELSNKHGCVLDTKHTVVIIPLEAKNDQAKMEDRTKKDK